MSIEPETDATTQTDQPTAIGRTSATEREAITSDEFAFWLPDDVIVNPFDIVGVAQVNQPGEPPSKTFGLESNDVETEIDLLVAQLWRLTDAELQEIQEGIYETQ